MFERTIRHVREVLGIHVPAGPHLGDARETCARALEPRTLNPSALASTRRQARLSAGSIPCSLSLSLPVIRTRARACARDERFSRYCKLLSECRRPYKPYSHVIFVPAAVTMTMTVIGILVKTDDYVTRYSDSQIFRRSLLRPGDTGYFAATQFD